MWPTFACMKTTSFHRRAIARVLLVAVLAAGAASWQLRSAPAPRMLIVHSYGTDLPWVGDVDFGVDAVLRQSGVHVQVRRHYMNLLNHPDCNHMREAAQDAQQAIDDWRPQVLVLVDDLAQAVIGVNQLRGTEGVAARGPRQDLIALLTAGRCQAQQLLPTSTAIQAIFFAGVNGELADYGYDRATNVSGVLEHKDLTALASVLKQVNSAAHPPAVAVQLLNDRSSTAVAEAQQYSGQHWAPLRWLDPINVDTFAEWQHQVHVASQRGAMLLIANYQNLRDADGHIVPPEKVIAWTERHSAYPAVGASTGFVDDGGLVTVSMSGVEQGEAVSRMALHYLRSGELLPLQRARRLLIGLHCALARKRQIESSPLYGRLRSDLGPAMAVSEHVYIETELQGAKP